MSAFDKLCAAVAFLLGVALLILGVFGLFAGCKAHFTLPPILGVLPAFVGWGIIRAEYRQYESTERLSLSEGTTDIDPDVILRDIGLIVEEVRNSKGVASAAYEAAHLFACYPP